MRWYRGERQARPGSGRAWRRSRCDGRRCGRSPGCRRRCRKGATGWTRFPTAPTRPGSRSAGRSPPTPLPATARRRRPAAALVWPEGADRGRVERLARAVFLARDLANTPAGDLGPEELAAEAVRVAKAAGARHRVIVGDDLLAENYPTIHAVGRASTRAPRLVDIVWGDPAAPKVTLVGKGVCFDTGGLDLKTASGMRLMKKDMAGAAIVLGLAQAIMDAGSAGAPAGAAALRRELGLGQCDAPARHRAHPQGADRRDRQHRCRRPADPVRRARRGLDRKAGIAGRHGDLDRGGAGRARPRAGGALLQRRGARPAACSTPPRPRKTRCGGCRYGAPTAR